MLRELKTKHPEEASLAVQLYSAVADSFIGRDLESIPHVEHPELLLDESYLWPVNEEEDERLWEMEEPPGYP